ncbi:MAG: hypothetical protein AB7V62_03480 [Thermoleophilia bacterium]
MQRYRITVEGRLGGVNYPFDPVYIGVAEVADSDHPVKVRRVLQMSGTAYTIAENALTGRGIPEGERFGMILRSAANLLVVRLIRETEDGLASDRDPLASSDPLTLDSRDVPTLVQDLGEKRCAFQTKSSRGLWCEAVDVGRRAPTALPVCRACALPDDRIRCSALSHPKVQHHPPAGGPLVVSAFCELGQPDPDGRCRPGGRDCWHFGVVAPVRAPESLRSDAPERLADEVTYLRLSLERLLGTRLPRGSGELGIGVRLASSCAGREQFEDKVRAIGSLLAPMHVGKAAEALGVPGVDPKAGSLVALGQVLDHLTSPEGPHAAPIKALRRLIDVRNLTSHHNADDRLFALTELGLELPIEEYGAGWLRVAGAAERALRQLRRTVEDAIATQESVAP